VRVVPGFNVVDDKHWEEFVGKDAKEVDAYVSELKEQGKLTLVRLRTTKNLKAKFLSQSQSLSLNLKTTSKSMD